MDWVWTGGENAWCTQVRCRASDSDNQNSGKKGLEGEKRAGVPHHCLCKVWDFFLWEVTMI